MPNGIQVSIKKVEIQRCVQDMFAKWGSPENKKIAKRNLKTIDKVLKERGGTDV